jgi:hypothetical protein
VLPAYTLRTFLRYFDSVDTAASAGLLVVRPHSEVTLTSTLCDLMDEVDQRRLVMTHYIDWLRERLAQLVPVTDVEFRIDTYEYPTRLENWVTQSDLGLVVEFEDHLARGRDWSAAALLQAKRLMPTATKRYAVASKYAN